MSASPSVSDAAEDGADDDAATPRWLEAWLHVDGAALVGVPADLRTAAPLLGAAAAVPAGIR